MADRKHILAVDLGTSGPKVALVSTAGEVSDIEFEPNHVDLLPGGGAEQDPGEWWTSVMTATRRLLGRGIVPRGDIVAVSCTGQWSGTVAVDEAGNHLMNAVIWRDSRGLRHLHPVMKGLVTYRGWSVWKIARWIRLSAGIPGPAGKDPIAHILFIKNEHPEGYRRTHKFLEPKDWLNMKFTGRFAATWDSITLHWVTDTRDPSTVRYDDWLLRKSTIDREKLPDLVRAVDVLGPIREDVARDLGLDPGVVVVGGSPDVQSASVGSGAVADYDAHLYYGTSSWITCHVPFKKTDISSSLASLPSSIPGRYLVTNEQESAGACLNWLRDNILFHDDELRGALPGDDVHEAFDRIAATVPPGSGGVLFTPWLYGERTPVEEHTLRSTFFNMSLETTRAHVVRSVFEGISYNSRWLFEAVERFAGRRIGSVRIIGGGARSRLWCQICADVLDRKVLQVAQPIRANLRGAGMIAAVAIGALRFEDVPGTVGIEETFEPDPANRATYERMYREFLELYKGTRKIQARLNG